MSVQRFVSLILCLAIYFAGSSQPVVQFLANSDTVSEGAGQLLVFISITNPGPDTVSVEINVLPGGSAHYDENFTYSTTPITFPPGQNLNQFVLVNLIDDSIQDGNKSFIFELVNPTNGVIGSNNEDTITILNDDTTRLSILQTDTVPKSAGAITMPVSLDIKNIDTVAVQVVVNQSLTTAVAGTEYSFNDTILTWLPLTGGSINFPVTIINDTFHEMNKTLALQLINPTNGAVLSDSILILTLRENDSIYFRFVAMSDTVSQTVGSVPVMIEVINPAHISNQFYIVGVDSETTAIEGSGGGPDYDFTYIPSPIKDTDSITYNTIDIVVVQNQLISPTKKLTLTFTDLPPNAVVIPDSTYTLYITNNNVLTVSFLGAGFSYPKGSGLVEVPVTLSTYWAQPVTATVSLAPGSAVYGLDYFFDDTTVVFPAYSTDTQGVWVNIFNNDTFEANKQINFNLINPIGGAILGITGFTLTIINDDSLVQGIPVIDLGNDLKVFPNPASNVLNVQSQNILNKVEIRDMPGKTVLNAGSLRAGKSELDITALPEGMYFLTITAGDEVYSKPFIKCE